ncbi:hypothetical protein CWI36_1435p0010 [Hamiltosporidium magnivora]|uniref:Uncharacterized protein n=1 Tax=Hamiltosporidium magnivora TaxID=148818 RepID=A0A4Q9L269_9MICR|nr:hypothetical protein CWI36_1435p0010 [Hamiltosporidium magnivora]
MLECCCLGEAQDGFAFEYKQATDILNLGEFLAYEIGFTHLLDVDIVEESDRV